MTLIRPFIPARDFTVSKAFYQAVGFTLSYEDEQLAIFDTDGAGLPLQNLYVREWAENFMAQIFVTDLDRWWARVAALTDRFDLQLPQSPRMQPWGISVGFLWDPSGVLWQVSEAPKH